MQQVIFQQFWENAKTVQQALLVYFSTDFSSEKYSAKEDGVKKFTWFFDPHSPFLQDEKDCEVVFCRKTFRFVTFCSKMWC